MNQAMKEQLEKDITEAGKKIGVTFSTLQLHSAATEMGLLDAIEVNYPSKVITETITVAYPDPKNKDRIVERKVKSEKRVLMTDEEALDFHNQVAMERVAGLIAKGSVTTDDLLAYIKQRSEPAPAKPKRTPKKPKA